MKRIYALEYGEAAYTNWKLREAHIDSLMRGGEYTASQIRELREKNLRCMKEEGAHHNDPRVI